VCPKVNRLVGSRVFCYTKFHFFHLNILIDRVAVAILKDGIYAQSGSVHPSYWKSVLEHLKDLTSRDQFTTWIMPLEVDSFENGLLTLRVPTDFFKIFIKNHFEKRIADAMEVVLGVKCSVGYQVGAKNEGVASEAKPSFNQDPPEQFQLDQPLIESPGDLISGGAGFSSLVSGNGLIKTSGRYIDTRHTFENFIVGVGNQFAFAATKGVALNPGRKHNPLLIYGASGLGKTHLLHALAIEIFKNNPAAKVCYLPAEQFVNDFIEATQRSTLNSFKTRYRSNFDIFLIDDIQFFAGKGRSQEEFFYTFNHLCESHHQVVMTSDKSPKELSGLEARLITRLQQGLTVDIKAPDLETRIAILKAKAESDDLYLPEDVCLMIASNIRNSIRELEGALVRLGAEASINGSEITLEMAREALSDMFSSNRGDAVNISTIKQYVSQYFKISLAELDSQSRARKFAEPRQIAMYLSRKYANKTYPEIALLFGGKDHSTVIHAIRKIEKSMTISPQMKRQIEDLQQML
jgi:chromosomal replication initiator protein